MQTVHSEIITLCSLPSFPSKISLFVSSSISILLKLYSAPSGFSPVWGSLWLWSLSCLVPRLPRSQTSAEASYSSPTFTYNLGPTYITVNFGWHSKISPPSLLSYSPLLLGVNTLLLGAGSQPSTFPLPSSSSHLIELTSCRCYWYQCSAPPVHILCLMELPNYAEDVFCSVLFYYPGFSLLVVRFWNIFLKFFFFLFLLLSYLLGSQECSGSRWNKIGADWR